MSARRNGSWGLPRVVAATAVAAAVGLVAGPAWAEGPATPDGKGIAGGILLGAEVVMITEAIIGIDEVWPYPVFGAVGAGAGAVGGWGIEQTGSAEGATYFLAGGMALVVPTLVAVLNATAYDPDSEEGADDGVEPDEDPGAPSVEGQLDVEARRSIPPALIGVDAAGLALGVPAVELRPLYSPEEQAKFGVAQATELRFPLVHGSF